MKNIFCILVCGLLATVTPAHAQHQGAATPDTRVAHPSFEQFLKEKTAFIVAEMHLPAPDSARFVPVYAELQQKKGEIFRQYASAGRALRRWHKEHAGHAAPDSLYLKAVLNEAQMGVDDARLEQEYIQRFAQLLKPRQLHDYMRAERKFKTKYLSPQHETGTRQQRARAKESGQQH